MPLLLAQSLIGFLFNTAVLGFSINIAAGLFGVAQTFYHPAWQIKITFMTPCKLSSLSVYKSDPLAVLYVIPEVVFNSGISCHDDGDRMMNMITQRFRQAVNAGTCIGTIDSSQPFNAGLVELSERSFPLPHGDAYVMFARQRDPEPEHTTKELTLSFSKGLANDTYSLTPDSHAVRLTFADNSDPAKPVIYTQREGTAELAYDDSTGFFSGALKSVIVENRDDDVLKELTIDVEFLAKGSIAMSSRSRVRTLAA